MVIIKESNINYHLNQTESNIQPDTNVQIKLNKDSKVNEYFDSLYSYPPKIRIKWDSIDELNKDIKYNAPFVDFFHDSVFKKSSKAAIDNTFLKEQYLNGFINKLNSSNFFLKKTKEIQTKLASIPTFVILNGNKEIILSKPSNFLGSKTFTSYVNEKLYDSCGAFDQSVEKKSELGFFFMSRTDAENYLKEVARSDFEGTRAVGLSLHCINLDSAYKITREHHPGVDFRFVPNFAEVKNQLLTNIGKSNLIIDDEQQQLRFRRRNSNFFPYLKRIGVYLSPGFSFLQNNEYFKGVPIYIVQISEKPRSLFNETYFYFTGTIGNFYNKCTQFLYTRVGFGHNSIIQGSVKNATNSDKIKTYIFFEKAQAIKFIKKNGRKVARYNGGRTSNLSFVARQPKLFVYNLEDFLEDYEDKIVSRSPESNNEIRNLFTSNSTHFISPNLDNSNNFEKNLKRSVVKNLNQEINVKLRVLKRTIGIFFSIN